MESQLITICYYAIHNAHANSDTHPQETKVRCLINPTYLIFRCHHPILPVFFLPLFLFGKPTLSHICGIDIISKLSSNQEPKHTSAKDKKNTWISTSPYLATHLTVLRCLTMKSKTLLKCKPKVSSMEQQRVAKWYIAHRATSSR